VTLRTDLTRFVLAGIGPVAGAAAQFSLALVLVQLAPEREYGLFAFLLVFTQLALGAWGALFCAPLPILLAEQHGEDRADPARGVLAASAMCAAAAAVVFFLLGRALGLEVGTGLLYAASSALLLQRWVARAHAFAELRLMAVMLSDVAYAALVLLASLALYALRSGQPLALAWLVLLLGVALSFLPLGWRATQLAFAPFPFAVLGAYRPVWRQYAGWSLVGVLTTELTANFHAYAVTFVHGPQGYAVIAVTNLLIRPVTVAMNALGELERAHLARRLAEEGATEGLGRSLRALRASLGLVWLATGVSVAVILTWFPRLLFPEHYALRDLTFGLALWMSVAVVRLLRVPESTLLQAAGRFRSLASASVVSAGVSVVTVCALLVVAGPLWSLAGILVGELVFAIFIWRHSRAWQHKQRGSG
jgi:hypothetical protein